MRLELPLLVEPSKPSLGASRMKTVKNNLPRYIGGQRAANKACSSPKNEQYHEETLFVK
jgi:hypothetical protein